VCPTAVGEPRIVLLRCFFFVDFEPFTDEEAKHTKAGSLKRRLEKTGQDDY